MESAMPPPAASEGEGTGQKCLNITNIFKLGMSFLLIFSAYLSVQNLMPQVLEDMGFDSLGFILVAVVYVAFMFFCTVSAVVLQFVDEKKVLILSSVGYATFVAAFLLPVGCPACASGLIAGVLIFAAAVSGVCAAFLWVGQGAAMTFNSPQHLVNTYQSIFQASFQAAQPTGSLISYFLVDTPVLFFSVFSVISVGGTLQLMTMKEPARHPTIPERKAEHSSLREALEPMVLFVRKDVRARCIMAISALSGLWSNTVPGCVLPMFVASTQQLAKIQLIHGCSCFASGLAFSRLASLIGRRGCLILSLVLWSACVTMLWISGCGNADEDSDVAGQCGNTWVIFAALAAGFGSGTTFTNAGACIVGAVHDSAHAGFGLLQASQSLMTALMFPTIPQVSPLVCSIVMISSTVCMGGYLLCHPTFFVSLILHSDEQSGSNAEAEDSSKVRESAASGGPSKSRSSDSSSCAKQKKPKTTLDDNEDFGACEDPGFSFQAGNAQKATSSMPQLLGRGLRCFACF